MAELSHIFNSREIATLIWSCVGLVFTFVVARSAICGLVAAFLKPKVFSIFIILGIYTAILTKGMIGFGFEGPEFYKDVCFWYLTVATVALFKVVTKGESALALKELFFECFKLTIIVKFIFKTYTMSLPAELVLIPTSAILGGMIGIASAKKEFRNLRTPLSSAASTLTTGLLLFSFYQLYLHWGDAFKVETIRKFILEPILTVLLVPLLFALSLWVQYSDRFMLVPLWLENNPKLIRRAKITAFLECGLNLTKLDKLKGQFYIDLSEAETASDVDKVVKKHANLPASEQLDGEIVRTRIEPYTLPSTGVTVQMAYVDWKNTSRQPIGVAFADIVAFDSDGEELQSSARDYCIFYSQNSDDKKVLPGEVYVEPDGEGFVLLSNAFGEAASLKCKLTRLHSD